MRIALIGHRGVGKSSLLKRLKSYLLPLQGGLFFIDLDEEIERRSAKKISELFAESEAHFRKIELDVFKSLIMQHPEIVISVGGGFPLKEIPQDFEKIWVRRLTDAVGRIFLDRPRLEMNMTPLEEFLKRKSFRDEVFKEQATQEYLMPEGLEANSLTEQSIFTNQLQNVGGILTLLPQHFRSQKHLQQILDWGVHYIELRDDLLSLAQIQEVFQKIPREKILLSLRQTTTDRWIINQLPLVRIWDWAAELGECSFATPMIVSFHQLPEFKDVQEINQFLKSKVSDSYQHVKLAPVVKSWAELEMYHQWQQQAPDFRSFLPRSADGIWTWYRLYQKEKQNLNFFRVDQGSALDQPSIYEWLSTPARPKKFAAVLGHPVFHSQTPIEQESFFRNKDCPVFKIDIEEKDFSAAMRFLTELGLIAAAVTAPLKIAANNLCGQSPQQRTLEATELGSVNTLVLVNGAWQGHNTDLFGFDHLLRQVPGFEMNPSQAAKLIVVWGGGGTLSVIQKVCPQGLLFSSRNGQVRNKEQAMQDKEKYLGLALDGPEVLIWAAGSEAQMPPADWRPEYVVDLNYREDSFAREYALAIKAKYISGLAMFRAQAQGQREFWEKYL